jgi:hypothetical protein
MDEGIRCVGRHTSRGGLVELGRHLSKLLDAGRHLKKGGQGSGAVAQRNQ